jgi:signal transduction histidine kinase
VASGEDGLVLGRLRRHDLGGQTPEQLDELLAVRDHIEQLHDLHDHVIEKLFGAGLDLQGTITRARSPEVVERLTRTVDDLQSTIEELRTAIFELQSPIGCLSDLRQRVQNAVVGLTEDRDINTTLRFSGPMSVVGDELADHVEAVIAEAVSNTVGHSATRLTVEVAIAGELVVDIVDNGCGVPADDQRMATTMHHRAEQIGGSCRIAALPGVGTRVHWAAPLIYP